MTVFKFKHFRLNLVGVRFGVEWNGTYKYLQSLTLPFETVCSVKLIKINNLTRQLISNINLLDGYVLNISPLIILSCSVCFTTQFRNVQIEERTVIVYRGFLCYFFFSISRSILTIIVTNHWYLALYPRITKFPVRTFNFC